MSPEAVRANLERIRAEVGPAVTIVAATKYVALEDMAHSRRPASRSGENRAQDLAHAAYGDAFRWHFIGHLQSNKAKVVNGICELATRSPRRRPPSGCGPGARRGEPVRRGVEVGRSAGGAPRPARRLSGRSRPDDDAARGNRRRGFEALLPPPARARAEHGLELPMGTSQDYRIAVEEGATLIRLGSVLFGNPYRTNVEVRGHTSGFGHNLR